MKNAKLRLFFTAIVFLLIFSGKSHAASLSLTGGIDYIINSLGDEVSLANTTQVRTSSVITLDISWPDGSLAVPDSGPGQLLFNSTSSGTFYNNYFTLKVSTFTTDHVVITQDLEDYSGDLAAAYFMNGVLVGFEIFFYDAHIGNGDDPQTFYSSYMWVIEITGHASVDDNLFVKIYDDTSDASDWFEGHLNFEDADGDGFSPAFIGRHAEGLWDCNDGDAVINPDATEICDGVDNNCDLNVDEGFQVAWYFDDDGDAYGDAAISQDSCIQPADFVSDDTDCNDRDATINPGEYDFPFDGIDQDCSDSDYYCEDAGGGDADGDGICDAIDGSDTDGDGFTDAEEVVCESDPADANSRCSVCLPFLFLLLND